MAKTRSPEYPAVGLKEAVDKVRAIWNKDYQNRVSKQVIAEHMGYKGLNGGSLPIISALSKYGLIEGRADETRVSDLGLAIVAHEPGSRERVEALREAANNPDLFKDLDSRFNGRGSDSAIRSYLLTQKFIPGAADAAMRSYRETKELVDAESKGYERGQSEEAAPMDRDSPEMVSTQSQGSGRPAYRNPALVEHFPPYPAGVELPSGEGYLIMAYGDRVRLSADVDLKGAKRLLKLLEHHVRNLEEDEAAEAAH